MERRALDGAERFIEQKALDGAEYFAAQADAFAGANAEEKVGPLRSE